MLRRKSRSSCSRRAEDTGPTKSDARRWLRRFVTATARAWFSTVRAARFSTSRLTSQVIARPAPSRTRAVYSAKRSRSLGWASSRPDARTPSTIARLLLDRHEREPALEGTIRLYGDDRRQARGRRRHRGVAREALRGRAGGAG